MGRPQPVNCKQNRLVTATNMKPLIILALVALSRSQYSGETQDLSNSQLDALKDIFGDAAGGGAYSGQQVGRLEGGTNGVEAIIQVVKNEDGGDVDISGFERVGPSVAQTSDSSAVKLTQGSSY